MRCELRFRIQRKRFANAGAGIPAVSHVAIKNVLAAYDQVHGYTSSGYSSEYIDSLADIWEVGNCNIVSH